MTLFEINKAIANVFQLDDVSGVDTETGEVIENVAEYLDTLQMAKEEKLENIACFIKNLASDENELAEQIKIFSERKAKVADKRKKLAEYLAKELDGNRFETAKVAISWRKSQAVNVTADVSELPAEYTRTTTTVTADKVAIKNALKAGKEIKGCEIVTNNNIQIK